MAETVKKMAAPESERGMATLAYLFTWITGLIILLTAKKDEKYKRWHAIQAIGLGIAVFAVWFVVSFLVFGLILASMGAAAAGMIVMWLIWLGIIALIVIMMVNTYKGNTIRLPFLADFADKNA